MAIIEVSIVFEPGARIDPDSAKLLEGIRETGSISAAARRQAFAEPAITAAPGGAGGGGATLTPFGVELLEGYERIAKRAADAAAGDVAVLGRRAKSRRHPTR